MDLKDKRVLVVGLGISGISTIKALDRLGVSLEVMDKKPREELNDILKDLSNINVERYHLGIENINLEDIDLIVKSPGVPPYTKVIEDGRKMGIEIITDVEMGFWLSPTDNIIAITGTNGKTTATTLIGEIIKRVHKNTHVVGNIGVGILERIIDSKQDDVFVMEVSSFQLENTKFFKPKVSLILNISPDHLDWHG